jgi:gluconolactonase
MLRFMRHHDPIMARWQFSDGFSMACDEYLAVHHTQGRWLEGPLYSPLWRSVVFSDIPENRVLRWDETTGRVGTLVHDSGLANGRTLLRDGRVVECRQGDRAVVRWEHDGRRTVLADRWEGARLNSPNDVVEHSDGSVWFTDPSYGIDGVYEGDRAPNETGCCGVYRVALDGTLTRVVDDLVRPNGLAFSCDESLLHVADTRARTIHRYAVRRGALEDVGVLAKLPDEVRGSYDGLRVDDRDRVWAAAGDGVDLYAPGGERLARLELPVPCSNLTFGGRRGNVLFITATNLLLSIMVDARAAS